MENEILMDTRKEARKRVELESKRADMKQHADKLIQGFEKLGASHAKRAIWELFQNAIDLSSNCEITIQLNQESIDFSHNGKPFISKTLISLIKQVSSKSGDNNDEEIGQYGTGFITTHSFGKKILINGSLEESEQYIPLKDFEIDRVAEKSNSDILIDKLIIQQEKVYDLVENGTLTPELSPLTRFSYLTDSDLEKRRAKEAIQNLKDILPFVMVLNNDLKMVTVIELDGSKTEYKKGEVVPHERYYETPISVNDDKVPVYYLKEEGITVALPINKENEAISFSENLSRLFLYFPLIGSEKFGFNFIVHAKDFAPTEPRDGVHLNSENDQVQHKEEGNRSLLDKASEMIFEFVKNSAESVINPINLADLNFITDSTDANINSYFQKLRTKWVNEFINYPLVDAIDERISPSQTIFFADDLLEDESYLESILNISKLFWKNIPKLNIAKRWTSIVQQWDDESLSFITIETLLKEISTKGKLSEINLNDDLLKFYNYLVQYGHVDVFDKYKLLPNIKGDFITRTELLYAKNLTGNHVSISEVLIPEITSRIFNTSFQLDIDFSKYYRKDLSRDLNAKILSFDNEIKQDTQVPESYIQNLITLCSIYSTVNASNKRKEITTCISDFYSIEFREIVIPNTEDDKFDFDTPIKGLVKLAIKDFIYKSNLNVTYCEDNIDYLKQLLFLVDGYYDYRDILKPFQIFPNQNFGLCYSNKLLIEKDFPQKPEDSEYLKSIYAELKSNIKDDLIHCDFEGLTPITNEKKGNEISLELDNLFASSSFEKINEHPQQKIIYELVNKMTSNKEWESYFQKLNDNKAIIMLAKISDPAVKNDLFSIIGLEDKSKIAQLGALAKRKDLQRLIELGNKAIEEENRNNADFRFKHKIGTHVEELIRERIGSIIETKDVQVEELQNGQDMVVKINNEIVYFIEVKSRWDNRNSITMSPRQIEESAKNRDMYSLCCVDMCDYYPENEDEDRYAVDDINKIIERLKVLTDIGDQTNPLIEASLNRKDSETEVTLSGDYRATVPQPYVNQGLSFSDFINFLITKLDLN